MKHTHLIIDKNIVCSLSNTSVCCIYIYTVKFDSLLISLSNIMTWILGINMLIN
jgi:hypothetical protein